MTRDALSPAPKGEKHAFTLLEVVLAVAIAGMVMTAATALLVAAGNAWLLRDERAFLETHASGVATFLTSRADNPRTRVQVDPDTSENQTARSNPAGGNRNVDSNPPRVSNGSPTIRVNSGSASATQATRPNTQSPTSEDSETGIRWQALPGASPADDPKLMLQLATGHPLLVSQLPAEREIEGFLQWQADEGLFLLWSSPLQEEAPRRADELNRTLISPWVSQLEYLYLDPDTERWERTTSTPLDRQNTPIQPRFLRLVFSHKGVETERIIPLRVFVSGGIPLY